MSSPARSRQRRRSPLSRPSRLFLFVVMAAPPEGVTLSMPVVLAFAAADGPQQAADLALTELAHRGWRGAEIQGAKELSTDPQDEPDPHARDAIVRALATGFDVITYG